MNQETFIWFSRRECYRRAFGINYESVEKRTCRLFFFRQHPHMEFGTICSALPSEPFALIHPADLPAK